MPLSIDGKEYNIPKIGKIILYPISKLAQALTDAGFPRGTQTLRKWELAKVIPKAPYNSGNKRLYSIHHINSFVNVVVECNLRQGVTLDIPVFKRKILEEWSKVNKQLIGGILHESQEQSC